MERIYCGSALKKTRSALSTAVITVAATAGMMLLYWLAKVTV